MEERERLDRTEIAQTETAAQAGRPRNYLGFRAPEPLLAALRLRAGPAGSPAVVARELAEWFLALQASELSRLLPQFSLEELSLLLEVMNGWYLTPESAPLLWAEVEDAIRFDRLDAKWGVDGPALVLRLRALSPAQAAMLAEALRTAWRAQPQDPAGWLLETFLEPGARRRLPGALPRSAPGDLAGDLAGES